MILVLTKLEDFCPSLVLTLQYAERISNLLYYSEFMVSLRNGVHK